MAGEHLSIRVTSGPGQNLNDGVAPVMPEDLIKTARKEKLPKGFSYPVGAQALSEALQGIPQFDEIELWFSWRDEFWVSRWQKRLQARGTLSLLQANYFPHFAGWYVYLYSVPSDCAVSAREHLMAQLPRIRTQLSASASNPSGFIARVSFDLSAVDAAAKRDGATRALYELRRDPQKGRLGGGSR